MKPRSIFLIGPPGAGKSTVGKLLANRLRFDFLDTDQLIEERTGADISWIFDVEGEEGFRQREHQTLVELAQRSGVVVATGGGIVIRPENRSILHGLDSVIYLKSSLQQLVDRTGKDNRRPLLNVADPKQRIAELLEQREPWYESVADFTVETGGLSPRSSVQTILNFIE